MSTRTTTRSALRVEQLEDRQLLSVTVTPPVLNLKTLEHGHGVFTVRIVSDTTDAKSLLGSPSTLTATVTEGSTTINLGTASGSTNGPVKVISQDFNGDGVNDLMLKFRRSALKGLTAGTATLTVSSTGSGGSGTTAPSETATITVFGSSGHGQGNGNGHGHHGEHGNGHHGGHGHGHG